MFSCQVKCKVDARNRQGTHFVGTAAVWGQQFRVRPVGCGFGFEPKTQAKLEL
jgi:hypothetical protein